MRYLILIPVVIVLSVYARYGTLEPCAMARQEFVARIARDAGFQAGELAGRVFDHRATKNPGRCFVAAMTLAVRP